MNKLNVYNLQLIKENSVSYSTDSKIHTPKEAADIFTEALNLDKKAEEYLYMMALGTKNNVLGCMEISHGSINTSIVHPRELFKRALLLNAVSIVIAHNHPSGDPAPSREDINITERIKECGHILGIELLDHIIVGDNKFLSLKERGLI